MINISKLYEPYKDRTIVGAKICVLFDLDKESVERRVEICEIINKKIFETLDDLGCDIHYIQRSYLNDYMMKKELEQWD